MGKRKELSLKEKVQLIKQSDGKSQRQLAEHFGVGKTQVQGILKRKAEIMEGYESNQNVDRKRICQRSPMEEVNTLMWQWFQTARSQGIPVSGPMLQEKALVYAKDLGLSDDDFKASNGWLSRFRQRHNINFASVCGESGSVPQEKVDDWIQRLPDIVSGYRSCDIYNMDETGLFFRALPDKSLNMRGDQCKGGKKSKDRITVMLCVNMEGTFEKPLVIGKSAKPRCFKNINTQNLPVDWRYNKKAWMTSGLFTDWVKDFNARMKRAGRSVLLLLDNAPSHPHDLKLSNVKLVYLPANTTSKLQPLDQGIIQNMKQIYRKRLLRSVLAKIDNGSTVSADELSKSLTVLDAIQWTSCAVKEIKPETVTKCFKACGLTVGESVDVEDDDDDDNVPIAELVELMRTAQSKISVESVMTPEDYINIDNELIANDDISENWENELIEAHKSTGSIDVDNDECTDDLEPGTECLINSHQDALKWIEQLKLYCFKKDLMTMLPAFDQAQEDFEKLSVNVMCGSKQSTLDRFLVK